MAFFDDKNFLLSHIRHSFITCDDTGICEMVMLNEVVKPQKNEESEECPESQVLDYFDHAVDSDLIEMGQSYDIAVELIGAHRHRTNTAQRLERMKKEIKAQAKVRNIQWKETSDTLNDDELCKLFPKKELAASAEKPKKSVLSEQLEKLPSAPNNPFNEYTRFDGKISQGVQTKRICIFLTMLPKAERAYPMEIIILSNARVQDLIGLICWRYTNEGREPRLKPSVAHYCLHIAEETGEVDEDFPSLDPKEPVAKFRFPVLALVEKDVVEDSTPVVTIYIEDEFSKIQIPSLNSTLREVVDQIIKHRKLLPKSKDFHLEKQDGSNAIVSLDSTLADVGSLEFLLVWDDSDEEDDWDMQQISAMEAPLYQSYMVQRIHKLGRSTDVQLAVSGEKVEITPLLQKSTARLFTKQKAFTYKVKDIAACEFITKKYSATKAVFKLVCFTGEDYKNYVFEIDWRTAQEIVKKVQYILDMHSSAVYKEYQSKKEQKIQQKLHRHQHGLA